MKNRNSKLKFFIFPFITLLFFLFRNTLHYILLLYDFKAAADLLAYPNDSCLLSAVVLGAVFYLIDCYGFGISHRKSRSLRNLLQVLLISIIFVIALVIFPYEAVNEMLSERILSPVFDFLLQSGFGRIISMDADKWRLTFYWHFYLEELTVIEWMVTYLTFQGIKLIRAGKTVCIKGES